MATIQSLSQLGFPIKEKEPNKRINSHASTLFHYTRSAKNLLSILENGLRLSYCKEEFPLIPTMFVGIPMISFCDIPIGDSYEHSRKYGKFAIGLTKESLLQNQDILEVISPVHYYISPKAIKPTFQERKRIVDLQKQYAAISNAKLNKQVMDMRNGDWKLSDGITREEVLNATHIGGYVMENLASMCFSIGTMKQYTSIVNGKEQRNYDECEWRIVVPEVWDLEGHKFQWLWSEDEYNRWRGTGKKPFIEDVGITFTIDCISFLIVDKEANIPSFVKRIYNLKTLCGNAITNEQKSLLASKVISMEQIQKDF